MVFGARCLSPSVRLGADIRLQPGNHGFQPRLVRPARAAGRPFVRCGSRGWWSVFARSNRQAGSRAPRLPGKAGTERAGVRLGGVSFAHPQILRLRQSPTTRAQQARQTQPQQDPLPHASFSLPLAPLVPLHFFLHTKSQPAVVFGQPVEVKAFQQASHAHKDKEACVRQDAQRQHGEADQKFTAFLLSTSSRTLSNLLLGACGLRRGVKEARRIDLGEKWQRGFRVVPMGWAGRMFRVRACPSGQQRAGACRRYGLCHDRDVQSCRPFFNVKAAGGGSLWTEQPAMDIQSTPRATMRARCLIPRFHTVLEAVLVSTKVSHQCVRVKHHSRVCRQQV